MIRRSSILPLALGAALLLAVFAAWAWLRPGADPLRTPEDAAAFVCRAPAPPTWFERRVMNRLPVVRTLPLRLRDTRSSGDKFFHAVLPNAVPRWSRSEKARFLLALAEEDRSSPLPGRLVHSFGLRIARDDPAAVDELVALDEARGTGLEPIFRDLVLNVQWKEELVFPDGGEGGSSNVLFRLSRLDGSCERTVDTGLSPSDHPVRHSFTWNGDRYVVFTNRVSAGFVDILLPAGSPGAGLIPYELRWHPAPARYRIP